MGTTDGLHVRCAATSFALVGAALACAAGCSGARSRPDAASAVPLATVATAPLAAATDIPLSASGDPCPIPRPASAVGSPTELVYILDRISGNGAVAVPLPRIEVFTPPISAFMVTGGKIAVIVNESPLNSITLRLEPPPVAHAHTAEIFCDQGWDAFDKKLHTVWQRGADARMATFTAMLTTALAAPVVDAGDESALNAIRMGVIALDEDVQTWTAAPRRVLVVDSNRETATKPCQDISERAGVPPGYSYPDPSDPSLAVVCCKTGTYVTVPAGAPTEGAGGCPPGGTIDPRWLDLDPAIVLAEIKPNPGRVGLVGSLHPLRFDTAEAALFALSRASNAR